MSDSNTKTVPSEQPETGDVASAELLDAINSLPYWKRFLVCRILRRKKWKAARAYNRVYCHLVNTKGMYGEPITEEILERSQKQWIELFDSFI